MAKIFYDHLVLREEIEVELEGYNLTPDEREEIVRLADETLHNEVLHTVLTHLPKDKHEQFLSLFHKSPGDNALLEFLKTEIVGIEDEIIKAADKVKAELMSEIVKSRKSS